MRRCIASGGKRPALLSSNERSKLLASANVNPLTRPEVRSVMRTRHLA